MIVISWVGYSLGKSTFESQLLENMKVFSKEIGQHVTEFIEDKKTLIMEFASDGFVIESLREIINARSYSETSFYSSGLDGIVENLSLYIEAKGKLDPSIYEILVLDKNGIVVASTNRSMIGDDQSGYPHYIEGKTGIYISDVIIDELTDKPSIIVSAPIKYLDMEYKMDPVGVMVLKLSKSQLDKIVFYDTVKDMGETGEAYIVNGDGFMITPSRFVNNTFLTKKIDTLPVKKCKESGEFAGVYRNYLNKEVFGASVYIPSMDWIVIVEKGIDEMYAGIRTTRRVIIALFVILCIIIVSLSWYFTKILVHPLKEIMKKVKEVSEGNLDYKIQLKRKDELGKLAETFNQMTENLKKKEGEISRKNRELQNKIKELERFQRLAVGRELRMVELKKRIRELEKKLEEVKTESRNSSLKRT